MVWKPNQLTRSSPILIHQRYQIKFTVNCYLPPVESSEVPFQRNYIRGLLRNSSILPELIFRRNNEHSSLPTCVLAWGTYFLFSPSVIKSPFLFARKSWTASKSHVFGIPKFRLSPLPPDQQAWGDFCIGGREGSVQYVCQKCKRLFKKSILKIF